MELESVVFSAPETGSATDWIKRNTPTKYVFVIELPPDLTSEFYRLHILPHLKKFVYEFYAQPFEEIINLSLIKKVPAFFFLLGYSHFQLEPSHLLTNRKCLRFRVFFLDCTRFFTSSLHFSNFLKALSITVISF